MDNHLLAFFNASQALRPFTEKAQQVKKLQRLYESLIPNSLLKSSHVSCIDEHSVITLVADNGAVAAKLRYLTQNLMERFQAAGTTVSTIKIKVQINTTSPVTYGAPHLISEAASHELTQLADKLKDSPLKTSLRRLALKQ